MQGIFLFLTVTVLVANFLVDFASMAARPANPSGGLIDASRVVRAAATTSSRSATPAARLAPAVQPQGGRRAGHRRVLPADRDLRPLHRPRPLEAQQRHPAAAVGPHWFGTTQIGPGHLHPGGRPAPGARCWSGFVAGVRRHGRCRCSSGSPPATSAASGDEWLSVVSNVFLVIPTLPLTVIVAAYLPHTGESG